MTPRTTHTVHWAAWPLAIASFCAIAADSANAAEKNPAELPVTGKAVAGMESYDRMMTGLLREYKIAGGALAVVRKGRLVLARGYGWADVEQQQKVQPESLFRIASISKPITSVTVLRLVEQGKLRLDARAFDLLPHIKPPAGAKVDPRIRRITLRQLLHHTGGWDRGKSYDAMFIPIKAAKALGAPAPADHRTVIRYMLGQPLDFDPGARYAYSNLGYAILGRVIEQVTGKPYDEAVRELTLRPAGIKRMRLGRTLAKFRAKGEVRYYHHTPEQLADTVFLYTKPKVPWPYGGFNTEAMDAHGGWIASPIDLVRFASAIDGARGKALLTTKSVSTMLSHPAPPVAKGDSHHYGLGWLVRPVKQPVKVLLIGKEANWWHSGSLPGTATLLVRAHNGMIWAVTLNLRPKDAAYRTDLDKGLWKALREVKKWPEHDLFGKFD